ncbi:hypothetical protein HmCmsJML015_04586 [Escherichia coli]|uniref:hypothetical protein n=1 Tax=Escherichia coli TaxID=562 RepID=UPI0010C29BFE|nr:hypothetical protein [Escherichia coli]EDA8324876.1 hypothetical protein [Salmonella enterica subsp. enterica serovar Muenchen]GCS67767.1 hypothetical protein HmCmsJML015_04586 [Escherichia coli]
MVAKKSCPVGVGIVIPKVLVYRKSIISYDPHAETSEEKEEKSFIDSFNTENKKPRCLDFD